MFVQRSGMAQALIRREKVLASARGGLVNRQIGPGQALRRFAAGWVAGFRLVVAFRGETCSRDDGVSAVCFSRSINQRPAGPGGVSVR